MLAHWSSSFRISLVPVLGGLVGCLLLIHNALGEGLPTRTHDEPHSIRLAGSPILNPEQAQLDAQLRAAWEGMKAALRGGDIPRALTFIHSESRSRYEATFERLTPAQLATIDRSLPPIIQVEIGPNGAEYEMRRTRDGQTLSYSVWFQVDMDGIWRLRSF